MNSPAQLPVSLLSSASARVSAWAGKPESATAAAAIAANATARTARTRNQARKFIRNEPHCKDYLERPEWADLVTDEVQSRPGIRVGPAKKR